MVGEKVRSTVDPSITNTLGPEGTVLIIEVSSFQGLKLSISKYSEEIGFISMCPC